MFKFLQLQLSASGVTSPKVTYTAAAFWWLRQLVDLTLTSVPHEAGCCYCRSNSVPSLTCLPYQTFRFLCGSGVHGSVRAAEETLRPSEVSLLRRRHICCSPLATASHDPPPKGQGNWRNFLMGRALKCLCSFLT